MNFQITQGTGTTIGTDSVAGVNFQEVKLIDATIGSSSGTGIASNPFQVSLEFTNSNTNPLLIQPPTDRPASGAMSAPTDIFIVNCTGISTLGWTTSGNWIGTMTHEVQYGDGQWFTVETIDTNLANDGKPFVVTQWTEGLNGDPWITNVAGATQLRFKFISYTSGSATITTNGSAGTNAVRVYNLTPSILQTTALIKDSANNALTSTGNALDVNLKTSSIVLPVSQSGNWSVRLDDGVGTPLTSTTIGSQQALDVNIAGGVTIDVNLDHTTDNVLVYGNDGTTDQKIKTDSSGNTLVVVQNATLAVTQSTSPWVVSLASTTITGTVAVTQSGVWSVGRTWALASGTDSVSAVQSGTWNINNISGTISLPTGAATEATLATRLADATFTARVNTLGQKTMANSTPVVLASDQSAIPVSQSGIWTTGRTWALSSGTDSISSVQSGVWTTGRTWTLASGTDSVAAVQSGTWNINNVSGTVSLPTGASTASNQTNGTQKTQIVDGSGNVIASTANALNVSVTNATLAVTQSAGPWSQNITQIGGNSIVTGGANGLLAVAGPVASGGTNADNPLKIGGVFNTTQPTVTNGQVVDAQMTARGAQIVATGVDTFNVTVNTALPAGTNVIGHVITDSGSVTSASQSGTWTVQQGGAPWSQNITQIAGSAIATAASGIAKVGLTDGTGTAINSTAIGGSQYLDVTLPSIATTGAAVPSRTTLIAGSDGTNAQNIATDTSGRVKVDLFDGSGNAIASDSALGKQALYENAIPVAAVMSANNKEFSVNIEQNLATGGAENNAVLLRNPNASGKTIYLKFINVDMITKGGQAELRMYYDATVTANGTSATVVSDNIGSGASSVILATTAPSTSATGTRLRHVATGQNANSSPIDFEYGIILPANHNILITGNPDANNRVVAVDLVWVEI